MIYGLKSLGGGVLNEYEVGNIRIVDTPKCESKYCYVFCSSNDIWYPNTFKAYEENIIKRDKYEWSNFSPFKARKIIYIRDIYKSWYVIGINKDINSISKLVEYIKGKSKGLTLVCIGSSSGGYLAILLGCLLNADYVLCFSAQMELNNKWAIERNRLLQHYQSDFSIRQYYDLKPYINNSNVPVYYIVPINCAQDNYHYNYVSNCQNIRSFCFKSRHHGIVVSKCNLSKLLDSSKEDLEYLYRKYKGKRISPILFSVKLIGIRNTFIGIIKDFIRQIKRKFRS